jgi:hypothetical protein
MDKSTFILIYSESPSNPNLVTGIPMLLPPGENIDYDILRHEVGTDIPIRMKSLRVKGNVKRFAIEIPWDSKRFLHDDNMIFISRNFGSDIRMYIPREVAFPQLEMLLKDCYLLLKPLIRNVSSLHGEEIKDEPNQSEKQGKSEQFGSNEVNPQSGKRPSSIYWRARVFR